MSEAGSQDTRLIEAADLDRGRIETMLAETLAGADDGELFVEHRESESLVFDDGRLKNANFNTMQGFGLRCVAGEKTGYAHAAELSEAAIRRAGETVAAVKHGHDGVTSVGPAGTNKRLYGAADPVEEGRFEDKVALMSEIDAYARASDSRVRQVSVGLYGELQRVEILCGDGRRVADARPLVRLNVQVVVGEGERQESGSHGTGGRLDYAPYIKTENWRASVDEALRQALVNLDSVAAPAGEMLVVLGPGWPGIMLHEAIGHGLEGDFNRKKTSAFAGLLGERVASPGVTVVDDGTIEGRRGSLTVDDEGTASEYTVLIEDGVLKGYIQDRLNARLMGMVPTGNGRRESFAHMPFPRMTNTYMLAGERAPEEIIASVPRGLYAVNFGGGQVDITSGKFVFTCTEAYLIEDGRIGPAVRGATLIGNGPDALTRVRAIGDDMALDPGIGTCGKNGQSVPVGVGQPTMLIEGLTVGGTG